VFDNGKDLHAHMITALTTQLNIVHAFAGAYRGDHKPYIERFNRTLKAFLRKIPGSKDKGAQRGPPRKDVAAPKQLTLTVLEESIWRWVYGTYICRPHAGLRGEKPAAAMVNGIERILASQKRGLPMPLRSILQYQPVEIRAMFSLRLKRPVDSRGVRYKYLYWNSGDLARLISSTGCKIVDVRIDPTDLGSILVWHPNELRWLAVPSLEGFYTNGLSLWVHNRILAHIHKKEKESNAGKSSRGLSIDLRRWLANEAALLRNLLKLTGWKKPNLSDARSALQHLGSSLDFAVAVQRLDEIDIRAGRMPPGLSPVIDLVSNADGTFSAEPKGRPKRQGEHFNYRTPDAAGDDDDIVLSTESGPSGAEDTAADEPDGGIRPAIDIIKDFSNPIAGFDPDAEA
jgi:hypothetical protein